MISITQLMSVFDGLIPRKYRIAAETLQKKSMKLNRSSTRMTYILYEEMNVQRKF